MSFEGLVYFQFPVGMSNRSYEMGHFHQDANIPDFQFPVGMSNRSYMKVQCSCMQMPENFPFNSPWECRIGLTRRTRKEGTMKDNIFQFPVGMSNRSYSCFLQVSLNTYGQLSIPRGNVE